MVLIHIHAYQFAIHHMFSAIFPAKFNARCWACHCQHRVAKLPSCSGVCDDMCGGVIHNGRGNRRAAHAISTASASGSTTDHAQSGATSVFHLCHSSSCENIEQEFGLRPNGNVSHTRCRKQSMAGYFYFHSISGDTQTGFACGRL